jgi:hypothetical protein
LPFGARAAAPKSSPMKDDIKQFRAVARKHKMSPEQAWEFSDYLHSRKDSGAYGSGPRGDFTYQELDDLAKDFLEEAT